MTDIEFLSHTPIAAGETHVWSLSQEREVEVAIESSLSLLSAEERLTYERYRSDSRRAEFAAGRLLARTILGACLRIPPSLISISKNPYGKPFLSNEGRQLFFNLSHSCGLILCAVGRSEVGVDVEKVEIERFDVMPLVFSKREIAWVERPAEARQRLREFYTLWTRKEAVMKAIGKGFSLPATSVAVPLGTEPASSRSHDFFTFEPVAGYLAAAATERSGSRRTKFLLHEVPARQFARAIASRW